MLDLVFTILGTSLASESVILIESVGKILAGVVGSIVAVRAARKGLIAWHGRKASHASDMRTIVAAMERMEARLARIEGFVGPNGGKSLIDAATRLETTVQFLHEVVAMEQPWPTFRASAKGEVEWANDRFVELVGMPIDRVSGNGWISAIAETDRQRVSDEWSRCVAERRLFKMRFAVTNAEGRDMIVNCTAIPVVLRGELRCIAGKIESVATVRRKNGDLEH